MTKEYINEKKTAGQKIEWLLRRLLHIWPILLSIIFFLGLFCVINKRVNETALVKVNDAIISAASILSAVIITFLVAKVIQLRQEKLANWNEYHNLTQKVHHFRAALLTLHQSWDFWPKGLKFQMENKYKELSYYDVRKVVFVHGTALSPLAKEYVENDGGLKNLYLQLRSLLPNGLTDGTLYINEFDTPIYYPYSDLDRWITFECGSALFTYFNHEWINYQQTVNFNAITPHEQRKVRDHCRKIDVERYKTVPFGNELYDLLGQQFTEDLLPRLYKLSGIINGPMPGPLKVLSWILPVMILSGIIIPFIVTMGLLSNYFTIFAVSAVLSLLFYLVLTFNKTLSNESKITH